MIQIVFHKQKSYTTRPPNRENMPLEPRIVPVEPNEALIQQTTQVSQSLATFVRGKWTSEAL
jgi:hypothetical protein